MLLGLVPLVAMTIVGILVVPFVVLCDRRLPGIGLRSGRVSGGHPRRPDLCRDRYQSQAIGRHGGILVAVVVLGLIPFIGWLLSLLVVTFGLGAAVRTMIAPRPDMPVTTAGAGSSSGTPANA